MTIQDRLADTIEYVALQRLQSRYADVVTRRAWNELADFVRSRLPDRGGRAPPAVRADRTGPVR